MLDRAVHDLAARGDDRLGLLSAQHHLRDLRCIRKVREFGVLDDDAGLVEAVGQLADQRLRDAVLAGPQRRLVRAIGLTFVVGIARGKVPDRGFGLHADVLLVVLDIEHRLCRVAHAPDDCRGDLDRVAALVVDLQPLAHQVVHAQADLLLAVERIGPAQPLGAIGADVFAEQQQDRRFVRLQHVESREHERGGEDQQHAGQKRQQPGRPNH